MLTDNILPSGVNILEFTFYLRLTVSDESLNITSIEETFILDFLENI